MRSWILPVALAALLSFSAACGNGDDDGEEAAAQVETPAEAVETPTIEPEPEPEATETPVPEPEPTPTEEAEPDVEVEADPEPTPTAAPDTATDATVARGDTGIADLMLSLDDLPSGWTITLDHFNGDAEMDDVSDEPWDAPCGIEPLEETYTPVAEGDLSFQGTELGPFLSQNLVLLESASDAQAVMSLMRELFDCDEWIEIDEDGEEWVFEVNELPFGQVGDDHFALRIGLTYGDDPEFGMFEGIAFDLIIVQRDEYISMFMWVDLFGMSGVDLESLVRVGDEKIQAGS
jgi:hypothetical protein